MNNKTKVVINYLPRHSWSPRKTIPSTTAQSIPSGLNIETYTGPLLLTHHEVKVTRNALPTTAEYTTATRPESAFRAHDLESLTTTSERRPARTARKRFMKNMMISSTGWSSKTNACIKTEETSSGDFKSWLLQILLQTREFQRLVG